MVLQKFQEIKIQLNLIIKKNEYKIFKSIKMNIDIVIKNSIKKIAKDLGKKIKLNDNQNLLELFDSFNLVNLIIDIEDEINKNQKIKIQIADENIFDAKKSPLLKFKTWKKFVRDKYEKK